MAPGEAAEEESAEAEYLQGNYRDAVRMLELALRDKRDDPRLTEMLNQAKLILEADLSAPDLTQAERIRRIIRAFDQACNRLKVCGLLQARDSDKSPSRDGTLDVPSLPPVIQATLDPLAERAEALESQARAAVLERDPNLQKQMVDIAFEIETAAAQACRPPGSVGAYALWVWGRCLQDTCACP